MIPFLSVIKEKALLLVSILLLITVLVLGGMAWWFHRTREALRAKTATEILTLQGQVLADAAAIARQNTEINAWKAAAKVVATEAEAEGRVQNTKLQASQKEVDRLRNMPLPPDPAEFRKTTDPMMRFWAEEWGGR